MSILTAAGLNMKNGKTYLLLTCLLTGCMRNYEAPPVSMPVEYAEGKTFMVQAEGDLRTWWEQFNDALLNSLIEEALNTNYDVRIAEAAVRESRAQYQVQSAPLWPQLNAVGAEERVRISQTLTFSPFLGPPQQNFYAFGFDASWELDFFGKNRSARESAYFDYEASIENLRDIQVTMVSEVALQYVNIRSFQQRLKILRQLEKVRADLVDLNQANFEAGLVDNIALEQSRSQLEQTRAQIPVLETSLKQSLFSLAILLGRQPENIEKEFETSREIPKAVGLIPMGLPSDLLYRRPDLRMAEKQLYAAMANVKLAKADLFPSISLTGLFGYESSFAKQLFKWPSRTWSIGPGMNWPLFSGGRVLGNIKAMKAVQQQALLSYQKAIITALQDVESSLVAYANEELRQNHLSKALQDDKTSLELNTDLYKAGLSDFSPVLRTDELVLADEDNVLQSQQALMTNLISLYKALGGGWEEKND